MSQSDYFSDFYESTRAFGGYVLEQEKVEVDILLRVVNAWGETFLELLREHSFVHHLFLLLNYLDLILFLMDLLSD